MKKVQAFTDDAGRLRLALDISGQDPPESFQLFGPGVTPTTKGDVLFDEQSTADVMGAYDDHGKADLPVDYDHGMLSFITTPDSGKAAGWFNPGVVDGALWALNVQWTPKADEALRNREFRYFSPAVELDAKTRRVTKLINVALTNLPATKGQSPLVASDTTNKAPGMGAPEETAMSEKLLRVLGASDEAEAIVMLKENERTYTEVFAALGIRKLAEIVPAIKTLQGDAKDAKEKLSEAETKSAELATKFAAAETEIAGLKKADETRAHEALIGELTEAGKLTPGLQDWAKGISTEALKQFGDAAPVAKPDESPPKPDGDSTAGITPQMQKMSRALNIPIEKLLETQKADQAKWTQMLNEAKGA
jgi:phage I-like protein